MVKHGLGRRVLHGYMEGVLPVGDVILRLGVGDADGKVLGALGAGGIGDLGRRLRAAALADVGHALGIRIVVLAAVGCNVVGISAEQRQCVGIVPGLGNGGNYNFFIGAVHNDTAQVIKE